MKRSSSTTHIPVFKNETRPRSKSSVRGSIKDEQSASKRNRAGSTERALPLKRSSSFLSRKPSTTPTLGLKNTLTFKKSTGVTPTLSGFKRSNSNLTTPRNKSPFKERSTDKKWISEQFAKVRRFLQEHPNCPDHIPDSIKPPTINTFVTVFNLLFKEIDPRFEINTTNYKDIVLNTLKLYQFPGSISNSLLKTVNTMHAWPQVISILSWLVDLITFIRNGTMPDPNIEQDPTYQKYECIVDYIVRRYELFNANEDEEIADQEVAERLARILNIDEEENQRLKREVEKLNQVKEQQLQQLQKQKNENDMLRKHITKLQNECESYDEDKEQRKQNLDYTLGDLKTRKEKLVKLIQTKRKNIETLETKIECQPCTVEEKRRILKHIDELKHTIDLKKEKLKNQKLIKTNCDSRLVEAKKKVETEIYRINNDLIALTMTEPELKVLQLKEDTDFLSAEFQNAVHDLPAKIKEFENKFNEEIMLKQTSISKVKSDISTMEQQIKTSKATIQGLTEEEASIKEQILQIQDHLVEIQKQRKNEQDVILQKIMELEKDAPNLDQIRADVEELQELKNKKEKELEEKQDKAVAFFEKLENIIFGNLEEMNKIRSEVFDLLAKNVENNIKTQKDIIYDLQALDELKE